MALDVAGIADGSPPCLGKYAHNALKISCGCHGGWDIISRGFRKCPSCRLPPSPWYNNRRGLHSQFLLPPPPPPFSPPLFFFAVARFSGAKVCSVCFCSASLACEEKPWYMTRKHDWRQ